MSRIEELEKRLAADPNSRIFVQLAEEYRKQGLLENAIEVCEEGLKKHPRYPSARVALGRALLEAENFDRASEEFEAVLAQIPDNILANKFLGETYHRLGRYDEAIQKYQIAQTLAPEDTELEGKIEAVKAEQASGGPPLPTPAAPQPPGETAAEEPPEAGFAPPPLPDAPPAPEPPPVPEPPAAPPPPSPTPAAPLEPPLAEIEAAPAESGGIAPSASEEQPPPPPADDLAPIPLVDVDEPMILEGSPYAKPEPEPEPPAEPIPVVPANEFPEAPPPPAEPETPPPPMEAQFEPLPPESVVEAPSAEPPPVEPVPAETPAAPLSPAAGNDIETPTMAELYASQGHFEKAILVYRNLLARNPNETAYLERIEELEMLMKASSESASTSTPQEIRSGGAGDLRTQQTIQVLEQWLDVIRRSRRA